MGRGAGSPSKKDGIRDKDGSEEGDSDEEDE